MTIIFGVGAFIVSIICIAIPFAFGCLLASDVECKSEIKRVIVLTALFVLFGLCVLEITVATVFLVKLFMGNLVITQIIHVSV